MNDGNQTITVSGLALAPNNKLTFANNTGVNVSILPGESTPIDVELNNAPLGSFSGSLNFILNGNSLNAPIQVPIKAYVSVTGLNENATNSNHIYPNPVADQITFSKSLNNVSLRIYNSKGQQVFSNDFFTGNQISGLEKYPKGNYVISITENNTTSNYSFIKK